VKVLHVITTIEFGGAENQLKVLVREQVISGLEVHIVYLKGKPELEEHFKQSGAQTHDILIGKSFISQVYLLKRFTNSFDGIVHAHLPRAELLCALVLRNCKLIVSRHNSEKFFPGSPNQLSKILSRFVEKRSNSVICISNAVKDYMFENKELSKHDKVSVIHYGYDREFDENLSIRKNFDHNSITIGTVGRLVNQKDYPTLLQAFKQYSNFHTNSQLLIVGNGKLKEELEQLSIQLEISEKVFWYGKTSKVYEAMQRMDIFVLASKYEGFGLVLLEAIQAQLPVIAANNSAIPEVLGHDSQGLFKTGDSYDLYMKLLHFTKKENRASLCIQQRQRLEFFNPTEMSCHVENVYKKGTLKS
jgi:glycosyltransferase involved in cell wall biosynthesis